ncbi:MAG: MipA/OmpV family protein, partial [Pseudomonadota bacterium]
EGGFNSVEVTLFGNYALNDRWGLFGVVSYQRLLSDAADSPIVDDEGSANQFLAGIGIGYNF